MKNCIRVAVCVVMIVTILAMSLSVYAVDPTPQPTIDPVPPDPLLSVIDEMAIRYIYACMQSWGINIEFENSYAFNEAIGNYLFDMVCEFLETLPSTYSISTWIAPWQAGYDYWGNLRLNSSALEDIQDFVDWLCEKLGIQNNSEQYLNPTYSISGYNLYNVNQWYAAAENNVDAVNVRVSDATRPIYYFIYKATGGPYVTAGNYYIALVSESEQSNVNVNQYRMKSDATTDVVSQTGTRNLINSYANMTTILYTTDLISWWQNVHPANGSYFEGDWYSYRSFIQTATITAEGEMLIITGAIALPADNPDYTEGDGITIIDGQPNYELITFSGEVTNLPAIVSTGTVQNPGLDAFWGFIPVLAEETKDAIVLTRGLIYEMPEELVVTFFAVMGGLILFGVIKLMREH